MKTLFILIGPKGAGKSFIGDVIEKETRICFIRVEPIWLDFYQSKSSDLSGWQFVIQELKNRFQNQDRIMIESLGIGEPFE